MIERADNTCPTCNGSTGSLSIAVIMRNGLTGAHEYGSTLTHVQRAHTAMR